MTDEQFKAFMSLMMCSDPWPASEAEHTVLNALAHEEAKKRGFESWYVAYHEMK